MADRVSHRRRLRGDAALPRAVPPRMLVLLLIAIVVTLGAAQRQAQLPWWQRAAQRQIGSYWIKTDLPAEQANVLARHLNLMYEEYARRLASLPPRAPAPLNVLIFKSRRDYLDTLRSRFGVDAAGSGGMFFVNPSGSALAVWTDALPKRRVQHVLQHEGFHQFAYSRFGTDLPVWLNEGLAEFFGDSVLVDRSLILGQTNPRVIDGLQEAIELGTYIPFRQMLRMSPQRWSSAVRADTAAGQYHQAWSMVHFLVYGDNGRYVARFETYLRLLNAGFPSEQAFIRAFETDDIEAFENRWKRYALAAKPSAFITALERMEFLAEGALALSRRRVSAAPLDELREALRAIDFTHTLKKHTVEVQLRADDDAMFRIPMDDLTNQQPVFIVDEAKPSRLTQRQRRLEEASPMPPSLATEHLRPRNLSVRWVRDKKSHAWGYEIIVR